MELTKEEISLLTEKCKIPKPTVYKWKNTKEDLIKYALLGIQKEQEIENGIENSEYVTKKEFNEVKHKMEEIIKLVENSILDSK